MTVTGWLKMQRPSLLAWIGRQVWGPSYHRYWLSYNHFAVSDSLWLSWSSSFQCRCICQLHPASVNDFLEKLSQNLISEEPNLWPYLISLLPQIYTESAQINVHFEEFSRTQLHFYQRKNKKMSLDKVRTTYIYSFLAGKGEVGSFLDFKRANSLLFWLTAVHSEMRGTFSSMLHLSETRIMSIRDQRRNGIISLEERIQREREMIFLKVKYL